MRNNLDEDSNSSSSSLPSKKIKLSTKHSSKLNGEHSKLSKRESCMENVTSDDEVISLSGDSYHSSISLEDVRKEHGKNIKTKRKDEYKVTDSDDSSCHDKEQSRVGSLNHKHDISDGHLSTEKFSNKPSRLSRGNLSHMSDSSLSDSSRTISLKPSKNKNEMNCTKETSDNELISTEIAPKHFLNVPNDVHNNVNENSKKNTSVENILDTELGIESEFNMINNKDQIKDQQDGESTEKVSEKESGDEYNTRTSLPDVPEPANEVSIDEVPPSGVNTEVENHHIESAIEWLKVTINDISDLATLVTMQSNKFSEKKITENSLKSYTDVLETFSKLKQLIGGVHTSYQQVEQSLESNLIPWKYLTGLENPNHDNSVLFETSPVNMSIENINDQNNTVQECKDSDQDSNNVTMLPETELENEIIDLPRDEGVSVNELAKTHLEENGGHDPKPILSPQKIIPSTETDAIVGTYNKSANQLDTSFQFVESTEEGDVSKCNSIENVEKKISELNLPLYLDSVTRDVNHEKNSEDAENNPVENKNSCDNALNIQEKEIVENLQTLISSKQQENIEISILNNFNQSSVIDEDNILKVNSIVPEDNILKVDSIVPDKTVCLSVGDKSNNDSKEHDNCVDQVKDSNQAEHSVSAENPEGNHTVNINEDYEALQKMLCASTDSEITSSLSSSDDSEEIQFDDSDSEIIKVTCNI